MEQGDFLQFVFVRFTFEGFHCWPDAPQEVAFLRNRHRHVFHVEAKARVYHDDRDREFILMKRELEAWCHQYARRERDENALRVPVVDEVTKWSCERWCLRMLGAFPHLVEVTVSEDGENGATVRAVTR